MPSYLGKNIVILVQIEDAAVLGNLFSRLSHKSQIGILLRAYEEIRIPRTTATHAVAQANQSILHLPDGPEQKARDASMLAAMKAAEQLQREATKGNSNVWADKEKSEQQYSYDADKDVNQWWAGVGRGVPVAGR